MSTPLDDLTAALRSRAHACETNASWPAESLAAFGELQAWRWSVPQRFGGLELATAERLDTYIALARGDMSTALFVTQHEGAVDLLVGSGNEFLKAQWLPHFASGEVLTTIGYSQLTTSRQGGAPAMAARAADDGYVLQGVMPWVTGAPYVGNVACGAVLDDGTQILALVAMDAPGVRIAPAAPLAALNSTHTCEVFCDQVYVDSSQVIAGPERNVLSVRSALRLLLVSATGIGLALGMLDEIEAAPGVQGGLQESHGRILEEVRAARDTLDELAARGEVRQPPIDALRVNVNDILLRLAGVLMLAAKGSGYLKSAVAQRLASEALFFAVWSASTDVRSATALRLMRSA